MRSRNIKPGFFKNSRLGHLPPLARILFSGLWCLADRAGRLEEDQERIKIEVLPYDKTNVNHLLAMLADNGFITRYEIDGINYLEINAFSKHQHPHIRELTSAIPGPALGQHHAGMSTERLIPDVRIPDVMIPDTNGMAGFCPPMPVRDWFESLWRRYPRRDGRKLAERSFYASIKSQEDWQSIQKALSNYISSEVVKKGYIKNGSTWFANWKDWLESGEVKTNAANGGTSIFEQIAKRRGTAAPADAGTQLSAGEILNRIRDLPDV